LCTLGFGRFGQLGLELGDKGENAANLLFKNCLIHAFGALLHSNISYTAFFKEAYLFECRSWSTRIVAPPAPTRPAPARCQMAQRVADTDG
jgi:hypothetical protein